ncbi:peroxidase-related enzyme [Marivirga sp.]|uniref:peroxidase-related enzyme n=1 Tax=Marivirga sp. TaxID=2018662 RepID=UPI003DA764D5
MSRIKVIEPHEAEGRLKEIYNDLEKSRGQIAEVHKIQSLRPESIVKHMDLYMEIMFSKSELSRAKREMIAVVVSMANDCRYCASHHGSALNHYWKDEQRLEKLMTNYRKVDLSDDEMALCHFAEKLTKEPGITNEKDLSEELRHYGLSDSAILDATLVVSYFNFVNRMVLNLGVELEEDAGKNYKY